MYHNFSDEYKRLMLETEATVQSNNFLHMMPQHVFYQLMMWDSGIIYDIITSYGINKAIVEELFNKDPFYKLYQTQLGIYEGISPSLKEVIVTSVKIAASFDKKKAGVEDFLLALLRIPQEVWIYQFLDYLGISTKDVEQNLVNLNNNLRQFDPGSQPGVFGPLDNILNALEEGVSAMLQHPNNSPQGHGEIPPKGFKKNTNETKSDSVTPALDFFGNDLTEEARSGSIDTIIGRDAEIDRLISILNRKTKNNPCLVGDPGVGKTAVVEGLALRIAAGTVPFAMQGKKIISLDLSSVVAGTKYRGEFESRIKQIIDEASKLENEIILFIDEIHTIIGAGSGEGSLDAANILKPAMGRGKICVIGATTLSEYQKYIEKDSALERRFQKIDIPEPSKETSYKIISGIKTHFEEFHNLIIDDSAIHESIELSVRYIADRFLPDKAIDLIDEACSRISMKYNRDEEALQALRIKSEELQKEIENYVYSQSYQKASNARDKKSEIEKKIQEMRSKKKIPKKDRLHVSSGDIQKIIEQITGVPAQTFKHDELSRLRHLESRLSEMILGQDEAIQSIVRAIKRSRAGISDKNRPLGSFLFLGPTGVGKTELVKSLAQEFYGDEKALIKIDMSEYNDRSSASKLIGTTAGYVGYEEGGLLTEKVRRKPYSIVLFDEIEKGNFEIFNLLLQILEDGVITDGKGRKVNFKNTIIIMTSNIGSDEFTQKAAQIGFSTNENETEKRREDFEKSKTKILESLEEYFAPEFINRIDKTVVFGPISKKVLSKIVTLRLNELGSRMLQLGKTLEFDTKVVSFIQQETFNPEYGARPIRRFIQDHIEDELADAIILGKYKKGALLTCKNKKLVFEYTK